MRKFTSMTGVASILVMAGSLSAGAALAQETSPPAQDLEQRSPSGPVSTPPADPAPQALSLQPGTTVRGEGGTELGKLVGARLNDQGEQELTVRSTDGKLKAVPLGGLRLEGTEVHVSYSRAAYDAAPEVPEAEPAPTPTPNPGSASATTPPVLPAEQADPDMTDTGTMPEPEAAPRI